MAEERLLPLGQVSPIVPPSFLISPVPSLRVIVGVSILSCLVLAMIVVSDEGWANVGSCPRRESLLR